MKQWTREQIMKGLKELVTEINFMKTSEEFNGKKGGIWTVGASSGWIFKGLPPFNHGLEYGEILLSDNGDTDPNHKGMKVKDLYLCGIHREIYSWLEERGWYPEWHDRVTLYFWKHTEDSDEEIVELLEDYQIYLDTHQIDGIEGEILKKLNKQFGEKND